MNRRNEILAALDGIKLLSSPAISAMQMLSDVNVDRDKLVRTLELDPALTTNVLRFANSAYFGCSREIHTVGEAVVRLGMKAISRMLYTSAGSQLSKFPVQGYDLAPHELWDHLLSTAVCTEILAKKTGKKIPDYAFTAALLHDVGKLVLGNYLEVDVQPILELCVRENIPFDKAETCILGINHAEVGAALLQKWNLPDAIVDAVRWHHDPTACHSDQLTVDLVHLADVISMMSGTGLGLDGLSYTVCPDSEKRLDLNFEIVQRVICELPSEVEKMSAMV